MNTAIIQIADFLPDEVLPYRVFSTKGVDPHKVYAGYRVDMSSQRYHVFSKSLCCCTCGLTGSVFRLEYNSADKNRAPDKAHFNLYAIHPCNGEPDILMTKDHIIPKSKGGKDCLDNYRTMCAPCNHARGSADV